MSTSSRGGPAPPSPETGLPETMYSVSPSPETTCSVSPSPETKCVPEGAVPCGLPDGTTRLNFVEIGAISVERLSPISWRFDEGVRDTVSIFVLWTPLEPFSCFGAQPSTVGGWAPKEGACGSSKGARGSGAHDTDLV